MNRRQFLGSTILAVGLAPQLLSPAAAAEQSILQVVTRSLDVNGKAASVFGLIDGTGKRGLTFTEGDQFSVALINMLSEATLIHWHGMRPPFDQDGVPGMPLQMLSAGEMRHYDFPVGTAGTHWMHAHTLQEQNLLAAPLIVRAKDAAQTDEQEVVILLHDFSFTPAEELLARLQKSSGGMMGGMDMKGMTMGGMDMKSMPMTMAMDLNDIDYDAYLANDRTLDDPEIVNVERGGHVRLRIINGATSTAFTIDTGELEGTLLAVDGHEIEPLKGHRFPITMGQRIDIGLTLSPESKAFPILALRQGAPERTGVILATAGAPISKFPSKAAENGPVLDLGFEAGLRARKPLSNKAPDRTLQVMLMGDMMAYQWQLMSSGPFAVRNGERVHVVMMNHSMMAHPMHLHGHPFQVIEINGAPLSGALRDTVHIPPMSIVKIAFDADHPGKWAFHCHHLFHMASGMMSFMTYDGFA
jgi:FtsP/CotA-like multicopper oxidase with cupredoxin domain